MGKYIAVKNFHDAAHAHNYITFCSYSRRVMWMEVATTNNDAGVTAGYFIYRLLRGLEV